MIYHWCIGGGSSHDSGQRERCVSGEERFEKKGGGVREYLQLYSSNQSIGELRSLFRGQWRLMIRLPFGLPFGGGEFRIQPKDEKKMVNITYTA
jgi:hypothetical protein